MWLTRNRRLVRLPITKIMRVKNQISKLPTKLLDDAIEIRDYLTDNFSLNTAKRIITNISACCDWAIDSKLIENNPLEECLKR